MFGGGDIGYVYSAYEKDGKLYAGIKDGERYDNKYEGYYYPYYMGTNPYIPASFVYNENDDNWVKDGDEFVLSEDCKVLIEPHCKVISAVTINGHSYDVGDYVPTSDLNHLKNKNLSSADWGCLDTKGIIIHNKYTLGNFCKSNTVAKFVNVIISWP